MKKLVQIGFLGACVVFSSAVLAEVKIAVVDQVAALTQSVQAKAMIQRLKANNSADEQKLKTMEPALENLGKQLDRDGAVMGDTQRQKLIKDLEIKRDAYLNLRQKVQKRYQEGQQNILQVLGPKFKQALEQVIKKGNYGLVIQKQALVYATGNMDITDEITAAMDAGAKGK